MCFSPAGFGEGTTDQNISILQSLDSVHRRIGLKVPAGIERSICQKAHQEPAGCAGARDDRAIRIHRHGIYAAKEARCGKCAVHRAIGVQPADKAGVVSIGHARHENLTVRQGNDCARVKNWAVVLRK